MQRFKNKYKLWLKFVTVLLVQYCTYFSCKHNMLVNSFCGRGERSILISFNVYDTVL